MPDIREPEIRRLVREVVNRVLGPEAPASSEPDDGARRRVAVGADHGGYALKEVLKRAVGEDLGWQVLDCGTHSDDPVDYPDYAAAVAREVAGGRCARGIIIDTAGIGSTMAANKVPGVRCALCHDDTTVINSRSHNDANVLALGSRIVHRGQAQRMVRLFLTTPFEGGRHQRRVQKIMALERGEG